MPRRTPKADWTARALSMKSATDLFSLADGERRNRPGVARMLEDAASAEVRGQRGRKMQLLGEVERAMGAVDE